MEDLGIGQKFTNPRQVRPLAEVSGSYTYFAEGDVLLAKITPCFENGKLGIATGLSNAVGFGSSEYVVFRPGELVDREWLYYFLSRQSFRQEGATRMTGAVGHKRVAMEFIEAHPIPLPPIPEQKRIVAILDEAFEGIDAAIANTEKNVANARELFDNHLTSIFAERGKGWLERRIGDIANTQYGLSEKMNEDRQGYKIFRMGEVQGGRLIDTGDMKYADITREEFLKYKLHPGDVLFNRTNSYDLVGKTGIYDMSGDYCFASYLVRLEADRTALTPAFLNYFMNSSVFQRSVKQKASRSINQANINATILSNEPIFLPQAVADQVAIVRELDGLSSQTQRLQGLYQDKLAFMSGLKQSILRKAFAGELTAHPEKALQEAAE